MSHNSDKGQSGAIILAAVIGAIAVIIAPLVIWYLTKHDSQPNEPLLQATIIALQTQVVENGAVQPNQMQSLVNAPESSNPQPSTVNEHESTTLSPTPPVTGLVDCGEFQTRETRQVSSGTFVIGDVVINNTVQYDPGSTSEGTVAYFEGEGTAYAEWGAGCYRGNRESLDEIVQGQFEFGCGSNCSTVRVVIVKTNGQQETEIRNQ